MATIQFDPIGKFKYTMNDMNQYHSYNDEPAIEYLDCSAKIWYKNGLIHRDNEPAIVTKDTDEYYFEGLKIIKNLDEYYLENQANLIKDDVINKIILKYQINDNIKKEIMKGSICIIKNNILYKNVIIIKDTLNENIYYEINNCKKTLVHIDDIYIKTNNLTTKDEMIQFININFNKNKTYTDITVKRNSNIYKTKICKFSYNIDININKYDSNLLCGINNIYKLDISNNISILESNYNKIMKFKEKYTTYEFMVHPKLKELLKIKDNIYNMNDLNNKLKSIFHQTDPFEKGIGSICYSIEQMLDFIQRYPGGFQNIQLSNSNENFPYDNFSDIYLILSGEEDNSEESCQQVINNLLKIFDLNLYNFDTSFNCNDYQYDYDKHIFYECNNYTNKKQAIYRDEFIMAIIEKYYTTDFIVLTLFE
jgi:hypothetical protein